MVKDLDYQLIRIQPHILQLFVVVSKDISIHVVFFYLSHSQIGRVDYLTIFY